MHNLGESSEAGIQLFYVGQETQSEVEERQLHIIVLSGYLLCIVYKRDFSNIPMHCHPD